jgi:Ca-activated chloride channel homolog
MLAMLSARSRAFLWFVPCVFLASGNPHPSAAAQTLPAPAAQSSPAALPAGEDYRRREIQPNLSIDRDPVSSPDAADNAPILPATASSANSQTATKQGSNIYTLHENVNEVLLPCTVVDQNGRFVTDLKAANFRVWEDDVPQTVSSFEFRDVPISLGILVDNSGSMRGKREAVDSAALDLVRKSNPQDTAFVVNFNDKAFIDQGFTSNISYLERGLSHFDTRGTTAIYDAVVASADELSRYAKWPKQVLLVITDGADNASRLSLEQAIHRVQQLNGPVVYTIGLLYDSESRDEAQRARDALVALSQGTGGFAYFPESLGDVNQITAEISQVIRNQYTVGYHSGRSPSLGGYRRVRVVAQAPGHGPLTVKTRAGYYPGEIKQMQSASQQAEQEIQRVPQP